MSYQNATHGTTQSVSYLYDQDNQRIGKTVVAGGATTVNEQYLYSGGQLLATVDVASGLFTQRYFNAPAGATVSGNGQVLAQENAATAATSWAVTDNQGSVEDVISNATASGTATILDHVVYDRYGNIVSQSNSGNDIRMGFTGYLQDAETGLDFANARYYQPLTGTFISVDPSGFASGTYNLYGYVNQNPTGATDPSGLVVSTGNNLLFNAYGSMVLSNTQQSMTLPFDATLLGSNSGTGAAIDWGHGTIVSEPANTDSISQLAATYDGSPAIPSGSWITGSSIMPDDGAGYVQLGDQRYPTSLLDGGAGETLSTGMDMPAQSPAAYTAATPPLTGEMPWDKLQSLLDQQSASLTAAQQAAENGPVTDDARFQKPINDQLTVVEQLEVKMAALSNGISSRARSSESFSTQFESAGGNSLSNQLLAAQNSLKSMVDAALDAKRRENAGDPVETFESAPQVTTWEAFVQWDDNLRQSILNSSEGLVNGFASPIHQAGSDIYAAATGGVPDYRPYVLLPHFEFQHNFFADPDYQNHIQTMTNYVNLARDVGLIFAAVPDSSVPAYTSPLDNTNFAQAADTTAAATEGQYVNLASGDRTIHILYGDATGGGHLFPGLPGKTPFPESWSSPQIMNAISDVATDPLSVTSPGRFGRTIVTGTRNGVDIQVILESPARGGGIVSGYPTNLPRNP